MQSVACGRCGAKVRTRKQTARCPDCGSSVRVELDYQPRLFTPGGNADAHLKRQVMGREVVVAVTKGQLDFGPWEQIFYGEFDGNRPKRVLVKVIGE
jgi:secondary thiamine-phosphate synthase enzyme